MQYMESGFSGSGVFVNSNGEKYLVGIIHRVEEERNLFIGWKLQKINEVIKGEGWTEIPLIPIELCQQIINQYNKLIENTEFVLKPKSVIRKKSCHFLMTAIRKIALYILDS